MIVLTKRCYTYISYAADSCPWEISGIAKASVRKTGEVVVDSPEILPQKGSTASTHIDMQGLLSFLENDKSAVCNWLCWWHSHPGENKPSFSAQDYNTLRDLCSSTGLSGKGFFVGIVLSSNGKEMTGYTAVHRPTVLAQVGVTVEHSPEEKRIQAIVDEHMKRVEEEEEVVKPLFGAKFGTKTMEVDTPWGKIPYEFLPSLRVWYPTDAPPAIPLIDTNGKFIVDLGNKTHRIAPGSSTLCRGCKRLLVLNQCSGCGKLERSCKCESLSLEQEQWEDTLPLLFRENTRSK